MFIERWYVRHPNQEFDIDMEIFLIGHMDQFLIVDFFQQYVNVCGPHPLGDLPILRAGLHAQYIFRPLPDALIWWRLHLQRYGLEFWHWSGSVDEYLSIGCFANPPKDQVALLQMTPNQNGTQLV